MSFDYSKLEGRIVEKYGTNRAFAKAMGWAENTLSRKLTGKIGISTDDIMRMSSPEYLDISPERYHEYFFKPKVQEFEH